MPSTQRLRRRSLFAATAASAATLAVGATARPAHAAVWWSSDRWGTRSSGGYTLHNNIWGSGYGPQTIWANPATNWDVWAGSPASSTSPCRPAGWRSPRRPLGSLQTTAGVGGHTWQIHRGSNGANQVYSFVRTGNTASGPVDVTQICQWIRSRGWFGDVTIGDVTIGDVQFGYEITSSAGGRDFVTNNLTITADRDHRPFGARAGHPGAVRLCRRVAG